MNWAELAKHIKSPLLMQHPLNRYTTWRTGGPGEVVLIPESIEDIQKVLQFIPEDYPVTWLGLGSNVLISDQGLQGLVIVTQGSCLNCIEIFDKPDSFVYAQAGVPCGQLARFVARNNKAGLEFLAGIPGTVGGALAMNAGCYGGETWDRVSHVEIIDRQGKLHVRQKDEYVIRYREVSARSSSRDLIAGTMKEYFLAAYFKLSEGNKADSLLQIKTLIDKRNLAQPTSLPNCGSVFKNPEGHFAAALIQECGLKGYKCGGAQISEKHANFIVNIDNASSADILALITLAKESVKERFQIELQREVKII
ncbi:MAG: UDP-N-acetylmuramate dehydrogenase [Gammaproteobacteria bacterium]|nr:UDP-N-acetylmuramate dehydrogenase [Gammaproteobacteria bacterium]